MTQPTGQEAAALYQKAADLVALGRFDEARAVPVRDSDRVVIEAKIAKAQAKK